MKDPSPFRHALVAKSACPRFVSCRRKQAEQEEQLRRKERFKWVSGIKKLTKTSAWQRKTSGVTDLSKAKNTVTSSAHLIRYSDQSETHNLLSVLQTLVPLQLFDPLFSP